MSSGLPWPGSKERVHDSHLGLIILIAAIVVGLAGIFGKAGPGHDLGAGGDFSIFGYHATGSTGSLFLSGTRHVTP
ncbi:hypothetical protein [Streptomyces sp. NBC_01233]|uniref:hypothetical protein n=1 Tax=Streptomyces sp. NBC_01233 TaxID=2903787 RepID=UPI002E13E9BB|nr:hypothetical protein OG332_43720 [Streptomyces sp. NBC_01233]